MIALAVLVFALLTVPVSPALGATRQAQAEATPRSFRPCPTVQVSRPSRPPAPSPDPHSVAAGGPTLNTRGLAIPDGVPTPPAITATSWLVADLDTGAVLGACGAHERATPASVQKLLLAAAMLPRLDPNQEVEVTEEDMDFEPGSSAMGLVRGGRYRVETLWLGLMLNSGNDAANTLARLGGGSIAEGVKAMNAEARRLGARAWDAFARADAVRPASPRELRVLEDLLVASLAEDLDGASDLGAAIAAHRASAARSRPKEIIARRLRKPKRLSPRRVTQPVHQSQQLQGRERLREEEVGAGAAGVELRVVLRVAGEHHDRRVGRDRLGLQAAARLDPVQPRHVDVQEDDRGLDLAGALDGLLAVSGLREPVARHVLQRGRDQPPDAGVVVDDQDRPVHQSASRNASKVLSGIAP